MKTRHSYCLFKNLCQTIVLIKYTKVPVYRSSRIKFLLSDRFASNGTWKNIFSDYSN